MLSRPYLSVSVLIACLCGCRDEPASEPVAVTSVDRRDGDPLQRKAVSIPSDDPAATDPAPQENQVTQDTPAPTHQSASSPKAKDTGQEEMLEPRERFLLLAPGGPLVVDLILTINGEPPEATSQRLIKRARSAADANGDRQPTWKELITNPDFRDVTGSVPDPDQMVLKSDINRNGLVDQGELSRYLFGHSGSMPTSFLLHSSNEHRGSNRSRTPLIMSLDADRNGAISLDEMEQATRQLLKHDADDDEILTLADFKSEDGQTRGRNSKRRLVHEAEVALSINQRTDWDHVQYSLEELYASADRLTAADFSLTPDVVHALDADDDGALDRNEIEKLTEIPSHIVLHARFGETNDADRRTARLQLRSLSQALGATSRADAPRVLIELPETEIEFFVNEDPRLYNYWQLARSQLVTLDRDRGGYLDKDEYVGCLPEYNARFESVDADGDQRVYPREIAHYVDGRLARFRGRIRAWAADREDALYTALDTDGDGKLDARELHGAPDQLKSLDGNSDGRLESHEIPGSMVVAFLRGDTRRDDQLFGTPPVAFVAADAPTPRWFSNMDTNGDRDISPREFLGTAYQFQQLDVDKDGFVAQAEATGGP